MWMTDVMTQFLVNSNTVGYCEFVTFKLIIPAAVWRGILGADMSNCSSGCVNNLRKFLIIIAFNWSLALDKSV